MAVLSAVRGPDAVLCDFCERPCAAVSTEGEPESRRARCEEHRVIGGNDWHQGGGRGRRENDWIRDKNRRLDEDVMPEIRRRAEAAKLIDEQPTMTCPQCGAELPDFDGFGVLAHTKPAYQDGCGYCSHPSRDATPEGWMKCGICGDVDDGEE